MLDMLTKLLLSFAGKITPHSLIANYVISDAFIITGNERTYIRILMKRKDAMI